MILPIVGPQPGTPEWYAARPTALFASECARAIGVSEDGQPLDVYLEKRGLKEPFEGNEFTERGKRFEPFIASEYTAQFGHQLEVGLPTCFHGEFRWIGATPDARRLHQDHLVEFKACNYRRAAKLGEEGTDEVFEDWLCQAQQQMFVMAATVCDIFVMVDLHRYKLYTIERSDRLIQSILQQLADLWDRIQRGDPPPPDFQHKSTPQLLKDLYREGDGSTVNLDEETALYWARAQECKRQIKELEENEDEFTAHVRYAMQNATIGRLPRGQREISRTCVAESIWTEEDVFQAQRKLGTVKRKAYSRLLERAVK